jgi:hypothetical protein
MGYRTRAEGEFAIVPPLTWPEFKDSIFAPHNHADRNRYNGPDVELRIQEESVDTPEGPLLRRTAVALDMREIDEYNARNLEDWLQKAADEFAGHDFQGYISCEGEENDDMWRAYIRDGKVVVVKPRIVWPEM